MARGTPVFGKLHTIATSVLVLALEERRRDIQARYSAFGATAGDTVQFRFGPTTLEQLRESLSKGAYGLVVIDTLFVFWQVVDENDNAQVSREVGKLRDLARQSGTSVLLVHHTSKSGAGNSGRAVRGASSLVAVVDGVLEYTEYEKGGPTARKLSVTSRFPGPPDRIVTFDQMTHKYAALGLADGLPPKRPSALETLLRILSAGEWHSREALALAARVDARTVQRSLAILREKGYAFDSQRVGRIEELRLRLDGDTPTSVTGQLAAHAATVQPDA